MLYAKKNTTVNNSSTICAVCVGHGVLRTHLSDETVVTDECWNCRGWGAVVKDKPLPESPKVKLKIKRLHEDAVIPSYAHLNDAGLDLTAIDDGLDVWPTETPHAAFYYRMYRTGLAVEIPEGYVGLIFPRSSQTTTGLMLGNAVGVIDSNYRGEITFRFKADGAGLMLKGAQGIKSYKKGDRIGQLIIMPYPKIEIEDVQELTSSERGDKGWGSSGS